jgi:hypothetical protein
MTEPEAQPQGVELLPFCGSNQQPAVFGLKDDQWWVECSGYEGLCCKLFLSTTKEEAIRRWNARADLPCATADSLDKDLIDAIAQPWICVEEKPCEEAVAVHWEEMITALVAAIGRDSTPRATGETTAALSELRRAAKAALPYVREVAGYTRSKQRQHNAEKVIQRILDTTKETK